MSTKAANLCLSWRRLKHSKITLTDQDPGIMQKRRFQRWVENYVSLKEVIEMNDFINESCINVLMRNIPQNSKDSLPLQIIPSTFQCSREYCCKLTSQSDFFKSRMTSILKAVYADYSPVAVSQAMSFIIHNNLIVFLVENIDFFLFYS